MSRTAYACLLLIFFLASCGPEIFDNNRLQVKGKVVSDTEEILTPFQIAVATEAMVLSQGETKTDGTFDLIAIEASGRLEINVNQNPIRYDRFPVQPEWTTYTVYPAGNIMLSTEEQLIEAGEIPLFKTAMVTLNYPILSDTDTLRLAVEFRATHGTKGASSEDAVLVENQGYPRQLLRRLVTFNSYDQKLVFSTHLGSEIKVSARINQGVVRVDTITVDTNPKMYQVEK